MADFPAARLLQADATLDEVAQLRGEFTSSDISIQDGIDDLYRSMSSGAIRQYLADLRKSGHFGAVEAESPEEAETPLDSSETAAPSAAPDAPESEPDDQDDLMGHESVDESGIADEV